MMICRLNEVYAVMSIAILKSFQINTGKDISLPHIILFYFLGFLWNGNKHLCQEKANCLNEKDKTHKVINNFLHNEAKGRFIYLYIFHLDQYFQIKRKVLPDKSIPSK